MTPSGAVTVAMGSRSAKFRAATDIHGFSARDRPRILRAIVDHQHLVLPARSGQAAVQHCGPVPDRDDHGDGRVAKEPCRECRGRGRLASRQELEVDIPAGISDGQRIRLSGHGHEGEAGAPAGDLYVVVSVREDERLILPPSP